MLRFSHLWSDHPGRTSVPNVNKPHCLNPHHAFFNVRSFEPLLSIISERSTPPQLCRYLTHPPEKTHHHHSFQIPTTLSTVHRHIFIFWKQRKKKKTVYDLRWRGENTRLIPHCWGELMVFIQFIFFTLCTLIHKDANNAAHIMFRSALVFPGTRTYITLRLVHNSPREI